MRCPSCDAENPDENKFCGECGHALKGPSTEEKEKGTETFGGLTEEEQLRELDRFEEEADTTASGGRESDEDVDDQEAPIQSLAPTDTTDTRGERDIWKGRYSNRAAAGGFLFALILAIILAIVCVILGRSMETTLRSVIWIAAGVIVLVFLVRVLARWFRHHFTLRYRLTTERLFVDKGLFSRTRDEIELIRVDDVRVKQGIMDRLFKVGQVTVISTDPTLRSYTPKAQGKEHRKGDVGAFTMWGIDDPDAVKEKVRHYTRARRKKSLHVESL